MNHTIVHIITEFSSDRLEFRLGLIKDSDCSDSGFLAGLGLELKSPRAVLSPDSDLLKELALSFFRPQIWTKVGLDPH